MWARMPPQLSYFPGALYVCVCVRVSFTTALLWRWIVFGNTQNTVCLYHFKWIGVCLFRCLYILPCFSIGMRVRVLKKAFNEWKVIESFGPFNVEWQLDKLCAECVCVFASKQLVKRNTIWNIVINYWTIVKCIAKYQSKIHCQHVD